MSTNNLANGIGNNPDVISLVKRLELATVRLEEMLDKKTLNFGTGAPNSTIHSSAPSSAAGTSGAASGPSVAAYEEFVDQYVTAFVAASAKLNVELVSKQAELVKKAFISAGSIVKLASQFKKPSSAEKCNALITPTSQIVSELGAIADSNRPSPFFNHLTFVKEGMAAVGWLFVEPKPVPFINEMKESAQFYGNRVLKEYKEKDKSHAEWVLSYTTLLTELAAYVKKHHTTGLVWNAKADAEATAAALGASAPAAAAAGGSAPAPPPPPPAGFFDNPAPAAAPSAERPSMNNVFSELNKGEAITSGLKKVDRSQMTHKNPELRASSIVKDVPKRESSVSHHKDQKATSAPPKRQLDGHKWSVENFANHKESIVLEEDEVNSKQVVYIYNCSHTNVMIKGKVNAVSLVKCRRVAVVIKGVVSTVDCVDSQSMQIQVLEKAPTIAVDKTDGCQIFISREGLDTELLTAKSSEVNISLPGATDDDDYVEKAVPEQFRTVIKNGKDIETTCVAHSG